MKKCPECGELNLSAATKCRKCKTTMPGADDAQGGAPAPRGTQFGLGALFRNADSDGKAESADNQAPRGGTALGLPSLNRPETGGPAFTPPQFPSKEADDADAGAGTPRYVSPKGSTPAPPPPRATSFGLPALGRGKAQPKPDKNKGAPPPPKGTQLGLRTADVPSLDDTDSNPDGTPRRTTEFGLGPIGPRSDDSNQGEARLAPRTGKAPAPKGTSGGFQRMTRPGGAKTTGAIPRMDLGSPSESSAKSDSGIFKLPGRSAALRAPRNTSIGMRERAEAAESAGVETPPPSTGKPRYTLHGFAITGDKKEATTNDPGIKVAPQKHGTLLGMGAIKRDPRTGEILELPGADAPPAEPERHLKEVLRGGKLDAPTARKKFDAPTAKRTKRPASLDLPIPRGTSERETDAAIVRRTDDTPSEKKTNPALRMPPPDVADPLEDVGFPSGDADGAGLGGLDDWLDDAITDAFETEFDSVLQATLNDSLDAFSIGLGSDSKLGTGPPDAVKAQAAAPVAEQPQEQGDRETLKVDALERSDEQNTATRPQSAASSQPAGMGIMKKVRRRSADSGEQAPPSPTPAAETTDPPVTEDEQLEELQDVVPGSGIFRAEKVAADTSSEDVVGVTSLTDEPSDTTPAPVDALDAADVEEPEQDVFDDDFVAKSIDQDILDPPTSTEPVSDDVPQPAEDPISQDEDPAPPRPADDLPQKDRPTDLVPEHRPVTPASASAVPAVQPTSESGVQIGGVLAGLALIASIAADGFGQVARIAELDPLAAASLAFVPLAGLVVIAVSALKIPGRMRALVIAMIGVASVGLLVFQAPDGLGLFDSMPRRLMASLGLLVIVGAVWRQRYPAALGARLTAAAGTFMVLCNYFLFDLLLSSKSVLLLDMLEGLDAGDPLVLGTGMIPLLIAIGSLTAFLGARSGGLGAVWATLSVVWLVAMCLVWGLGADVGLLPMLSYGLAVGGAAMALGLGLGDLAGRSTTAG